MELKHDRLRWILRIEIDVSKELVAGSDFQPRRRLGEGMLPKALHGLAMRQSPAEHGLSWVLIPAPGQFAFGPLRFGLERDRLIDPDIFVRFRRHLGRPC